MKGTDPKTIMLGAKCVIVLMDVYFREAYPRLMEGHFGRCYLDDDRMTRDCLALHIKTFRSFLCENGNEKRASVLGGFGALTDDRDIAAALVHNAFEMGVGIDVRWRIDRK